MLTLSRKPGQSFHLTDPIGQQIILTLTSIQSDGCTLTADWLYYPGNERPIGCKYNQWFHIRSGEYRLAVVVLAQSDGKVNVRFDDPERVFGIVRSELLLRGTAV